MAERLEEVPVFVPSAAGHLAGVVALPSKPTDLGIVFLPGSHIPRHNKNRMWTRAARTLTELGAITLRMEAEGTGDSEGDPQRGAMSKITPTIPAAGVRFLMEQAGVRRVAIAATCYGARLGIAAAAAAPEVESVLFVGAPVMGVGRRGAVARFTRRVVRRAGIHPKRPPRVAPLFEEPFLRFVRRGGRVHFLMGDKDPFLAEVREMLRILGPKLGAAGLSRCSLEEIAGHELHAFKSLEAQDLVVDATLRWAEPLLTTSPFVSSSEASPRPPAP